MVLLGALWFPRAHLTGATDLLLQNSPDIRLVFFEPLKRRGSEISLRKTFHPRRTYCDFSNFLENHIIFYGRDEKSF